MRPVSRTNLLTAVLVVLALLVGSLLDARLPRPDPVDADPYVRPGVVGRPVTLRSFIVTATDLEAGREIASLGTVTSTTAHWLVVGYTVEARGEARTVPPAVLRLRAADGRLFGETPGTTVACGPAQPGIPVRCWVPFEVPADALPGARLLVPAGVDVAMMDDVADIDLGISPERATELVAAAGRVTLPEARPAGR